MPRLSDVFSKYLSGDVLKRPDGSYGTLVLTIANSRVQEFEDDRGTTTAIVLDFHEDERGFVVKPTNGNLLAEMFGSDVTEQWHERKIELHWDKSVTFGGKKVGGMRVRHPTGAGAAPSAAPAAAPSSGPPGDGPPDSSPPGSPAADPFQAVKTKLDAWNIAKARYAGANKDVEALKRDWAPAVTRVGKPEAQVTADDWRNVAETLAAAADVPF